MVKKSDILLEKIRTGAALATRERLRLIAELSVPSMLAQVTVVVMFFIDASMVGHLGAEASAAIGLMESTLWLMGSLMGAVAIGFSVQVAHRVGAADFVGARQVFRHSLVCGLVASLALAAVGVALHAHIPLWLGGGAEIAGPASTYFLIYTLSLPLVMLFHLTEAMLKSTGEVRLPSAMSIATCVLDVAFNFFFIYILRLGVAGAAIGTLTAYLFTALPMLWIAVRRNRILSLRQDQGPWRWQWPLVRTAGRIGLPVAVQQALLNGAQVVSTLIVAPLGNVAIAAHSFAITAESLCYMPGYGIGDAASTLVGQTFGARRADLCRSFARMTVGLGMGVMALMGVLMYVFAPEMIGVLSPVEEIRALGTDVLRIEAFAEPFFAASIVTYSVCVGAGDTLRPAIYNLASMWCVRLTTAALLAPRYGLRGVWIAMAAELTCRGLLFLVRLVRGRWMRIS